MLCLYNFFFNFVVFKAMSFTTGTMKRKFVGRILSWILYVLISFFVISVFIVVLYKFINPPITPLIVIRLVEKNYSGQAHEVDKVWVPLDSIAASLQLAVIVSEDSKFLIHHGFDMEAIKRAMEYNRLNEGKVMMGASTISQQTAKNVFLWPHRSWFRKGLEAYFTELIELTWSKRRIMEVYMNVIEMGPGIYGVEAASLAYFHKHASSLTLEESALLAAILPNPRKWDPRFPTDFIKWKKDDIISNMRLCYKHAIFPAN